MSTVTIKRVKLIASIDKPTVIYGGEWANVIGQSKPTVGKKHVMVLPFKVEKLGTVNSNDLAKLTLAGYNGVSYKFYCGANLRHSGGNLQAEMIHKVYSTDAWVGSGTWVTLTVGEWYFLVFSACHEAGSTNWSEASIYDIRWKDLLTHNNPYSGLLETIDRFVVKVENYNNANDIVVEVIQPQVSLNMTYTVYDYGHDAFFNIPAFDYLDVSNSCGTFKVWDTLNNGYIDTDYELNDDILDDTFDILGYTDDIPGIDTVVDANNSLLDHVTTGLPAISSDIGDVDTRVADVETDVTYSTAKTSILLDPDVDIDSETDSLIRLATAPQLLQDELSPGLTPPLGINPVTPSDYGSSLPSVNWDSLTYDEATPTEEDGAPGT